MRQIKSEYIPAGNRAPDGAEAEDLRNELEALDARGVRARTRVKALRTTMRLIACASGQEAPDLRALAVEALVNDATKARAR